MDKEEKIEVHHRCLRCFKRWDQLYVKNDEKPCSQTLCEYCSVPGRTSLETLHRMVDIMPFASPSDYPNFTRHLMKHVVLKE